MAARELCRPNPEELLRKLDEEDAERSRGRLKILLGYSPRVGKSVRMFDEGRRRAARGQDVVVGWMQAKGAERVKDIAAGLEVIPPLKVNGEDQLYVEGILIRKPQVCLIDELAWDNPPGSRNAHRWQDIAELVKAGITVITAVNLQHVAEEQTAVERITGSRASVAVPQEFVESADEIVIVDASLDALTESGVVKCRLDAQQSSELRELALLLAAQVVDEQLNRYMRTHGIQQSWSTQERILVCVTPNTDARPMLESAARAVNRFHAHFTALYVNGQNLTREAQEKMEEALEYARKLGAETLALEGNRDLVDSIIRFARENRITQIFIGHLHWKAWRFWAPRPIDRLINAADGMDVRIFPNTHAA